MQGFFYACPGQKILFPKINMRFFYSGVHRSLLALVLKNSILQVWRCS